jgi:hypothetical protein
VLHSKKTFDTLPFYSPVEGFLFAPMVDKPIQDMQSMTVNLPKASASMNNIIHQGMYVSKNKGLLMYARSRTRKAIFPFPNTLRTLLSSGMKVLLSEKSSSYVSSSIKEFFANTNSRSGFTTASLEIPQSDQHSFNYVLIPIKLPLARTIPSSSIIKNGMQSFIMTTSARGLTQRAIHIMVETPHWAVISDVLSLETEIVASPSLNIDIENELP